MPPLGSSASRPLCVVSCVFAATEGSADPRVACIATDYRAGAIAADAAQPGLAVRVLTDLASDIGAGTTLCRRCVPTEPS